MRNRGAGDERVLILFAYVFGADTGTVLDLPQTHGLPRHHHHTTPLYLCWLVSVPVGVCELLSRYPAKRAGAVLIIQAEPELIGRSAKHQAAYKGLLKPVINNDERGIVASAHSFRIIKGERFFSNLEAGRTVPSPTPLAAVVLYPVVRLLCCFLTDRGQRVITWAIVPAALRPPDGNTILIYISKIVGFKWVPVSEDDWSAIGPFKVHLHSCIM